MGNSRTFYGPTNARQPLPCGCTGKAGAITYRTKDGTGYYSECLTCHETWPVTPHANRMVELYRKQQQVQGTCEALGMDEAGELAEAVMGF